MSNLGGRGGQTQAVPVQLQFACLANPHAWFPESLGLQSDPVFLVQMVNVTAAEQT